MPIKSKTRAIGNSYFLLIKKFPLVPIRDDQHLKQAAAMIDQLLRKKLDKHESAYLDVLSDLVHRYEEQHHSFPGVSQKAMLRYLLEEKDLDQTALSRQTGISSATISAVLAGSRELTKKNILTLAKLFGVSPRVFENR